MIAIVEALAMATGHHDLLHHRAVKPRRVLYWNLEDPIEEIERRFAAVATHFGIEPEDYESRLFFESGHDTPLKVATADRAGFKLNNAALSKLKRTIVARELDVVTIDPIVSAHGVPENDNNAIDAVVKALAAVATQTNCAILLVHHARKSIARQARASSRPTTLAAPRPSSMRAACADQRAKAWFGKAIAPLCQIDPFDRAGKKRLVKLTDTWVENGILVIVEKDDGRRRTAKFIGVPSDDGDHDDPQVYKSR
jgi:RecA-family ATPase